ncbi:MAG: FeoB-associated Cys-rich membrane protein [Selenomonadaceae bacterium]|nr:FeoB-associated Cys-rich membrane protein [Selenomonadaceae bacterium]
MATYVLGALLVVALGYALRHMYRVFISGEDDCCGTSSGGCEHCAGCSGAAK